MISLNNYMYRWLNVKEETKKFTLTYELNGSGFLPYDEYSDTNSMLLKIGAPNVVTIEVENNGVEQSNYFARLKEIDGYLVFNPYTGNNSLSEKVRKHEIRIPTGEDFTIAPTGYGLDSSIVIEVLDINENVVDVYYPALDSSLDSTDGMDDEEYNSADLNMIKDIVDNIGRLLDNMYIAIN